MNSTADKDSGPHGMEISPGVSKRPRIDVACDACRLRKVKCDGSKETPSGKKHPCTPCTRMQLPCEYSFKRKRPGPIPEYLRKLPNAKGLHQAGAPADLSCGASSPTSRLKHLPAGESEPLGVDALNDGDTLESVFSLFTSDPLEFDPSLLPRPSPSFTQFDSLAPASSSSKYDRPQAAYQLGMHPLASSTNPISALISPRSRLHQILDGFFDFVYPLFPLPFKPALMRDVLAMREERDGEEEWTAMILSLVGFTLVQVPHTLIGMEKQEMRRLVDGCEQAVQVFLAKGYDTVSLNRLIIMYCLGTVINNRGRHVMSRSLHGASVVLALQLKLNKESTYAQYLDPEREMFRRIWWLIYNADRSSTCTENGHLLIYEEECYDVNLPSQVEYDELPGSPPDLTRIIPTYAPVISGFYYLCGMWQLAGRLLDMQRQDRATAPAGIGLLGRISQVDKLLDSLETILEGAPEQLQLDRTQYITEPALVPPRNDQLLGKSNVAAFLVHQANLHVTQQMLRLLSLQNRDSLCDLRRLDEAQNSRQSSDWAFSPHISSSTTRTHRWQRGLDPVIETSKVLTDLLEVLHVLPMEVHAINSFPGVTKIRFVASTLLKELSVPDPLSNETTSPATLQMLQTQERAMRDLTEYIRILGAIEELYSLQTASV